MKPKDLVCASLDWVRWIIDAYANKARYKNVDRIQLPNRLIIRARLKKFKDALNVMIQGLWNDIDKIQECNKEVCINLG